MKYFWSVKHVAEPTVFVLSPFSYGPVALTVIVWWNSHLCSVFPVVKLVLTETVTIPCQVSHHIQAIEPGLTNHLQLYDAEVQSRQTSANCNNLHY